MKINIRKSNERGQADHGWLKTYHTFSFGNYNDPNFMGFRSLRVINEDTVAPSKGFDTHPHKNMEILTIILEGELAHKDSMGTGSTIKAGEVQLMSAGSGITHSEFNASAHNPVHLLQIWIEPEERNLKPQYQQITLPKDELKNLILIASKNSKEAMKIHQDANVYFGTLQAGSVLTLPLSKNRYGWVQMAHGNVKIDDKELKAGDGASLQDGENPKITAITDTSFVFFDLK